MMYRFDESFPLPLEYDECEILLEEVSSLMNDGRIPGYLKTLSFPFRPSILPSRTLNVLGP